MSQNTNSPTIVLTGGGSGGHITPLIAVAAELKRLKPNTRLIYIGQKGDGLVDIPSKDTNIDKVYLVRAGKFRRFHGEGFKQLLDIPTLLKNVRDFFYVLIGIFQARSILKQTNPDIIFIKGGFIGVPVGLAAANLHIPFITHDSDVIPGLANRIIGRWAAIHAVALPKNIYSYDLDKTVSTGIPLQSHFKPVTQELKLSYRKEINVPQSAKMVFVIGGGLGAQRVNSAVAETLPHLLSEFSDLYVFQSAGRANEQNLKKYYEKNLVEAEQGRVKVFGYMDDVYRYSGAADIIVTRAGATNLAEFALQGKACVVIPNPMLTGGHQIKNSDYLIKTHSAVVLNEKDLLADPNRLSKQISDLLRDTSKRQKLETNISSFAKPKATESLANLIISQVSSA